MVIIMCLSLFRQNVDFTWFFGTDYQYLQWFFCFSQFMQGPSKIIFLPIFKGFCIIFGLVPKDLAKLVFWRWGAIGAIASLMGITISLLFIGIDSSWDYDYPDRTIESNGSTRTPFKINNPIIKIQYINRNS